MKRCVVMAVMLVFAAGIVPATPLIGRSATVNKPIQVFGWLNFGYNQSAVTYNWVTEKWDEVDGGTKTTSCDVTAAVGLPGKVDINLVAPLAMKDAGTASSTGLGDVMAYVRYGLLQSSLLPVKVALLVGANLPTAPKDANPALGDRSVDVALGFSANTIKLAGLLGHARAAYWLNGKLPDTDIKVGNMLEYNLTLDYSVTNSLTPELAVTGYSRARSELGGVPITSSEVSQHTASLLLMWRPIPILTIRPKVAFPLTFISKGGSMANVYGGLDVWATLP